MTNETKLRMRMQDKLMRRFGFESPLVIIFCKACEWEDNETNNELIRTLYDVLIQAEGG